MVRQVPIVTHALSRGDLLPLEQQRAAGCCAAAQLDVTSCVELEREEYRQLQLAGDASTPGPCTAHLVLRPRFDRHCFHIMSAFRRPDLDHFRCWTTASAALWHHRLRYQTMTTIGPPSHGTTLSRPFLSSSSALQLSQCLR